MTHLELLDKLEKEYAAKYAELKKLEAELYHQRAVCSFEISLRKRKLQKERVLFDELMDAKYGY